jgi:hypothetical protein
MNVEELKRLLAGVPDSYEVVVEATNFTQDSFASGPAMKIAVQHDESAVYIEGPETEPAT